MLTASQNAAVVRWLRQHSMRPQAAIALWAELFTAVHPTTGEIMLTRAELAERVAIDAKHVSSIMTELAGINAITRQRTGRRMRYFMNPNVATHIPGTDARKTARDAAGPLLTLMEGANPTDIALPKAGEGNFAAAQAAFGGLKGFPLTSCEGSRARRSLVVATRVCWRISAQTRLRGSVEPRRGSVEAP